MLTMKAATFILLLISSFLPGMSAQAQEKLTFNSLDEIFVYADGHSNTFRNAGQQNILAKYQTLAAKLGKWNLQGRTSFTMTDNTKLSTNFIPAEIFGGPEGTFRPVTFGQKYQSNVTFAPEIDLFNPYASALVRGAKTNEQLVTVNNLLDKKAVYESISAAYHNILSYQWQIGITAKSLSNADTLATILQNKQKEGLARVQDVNVAQANRLTVQDKLQQLEVQLAQQYNSLKILADVDSATVVTVTAREAVTPNVTQVLTANGNLLQRQAEWQIKYQEATLRADKRWIYPTLNLFSSFGWQQNTNNHFFDDSKWLGTSYVGLRLSIPLLPEASKIASVKYDRVNLQIARNNWQHNVLQDNINNKQLELDYQKANKSYLLALQIESLRKDSYYKNLSIYREGILSATDLINSFDDWLNSALNTVTQLANAEYAKSKINMSNTVK
jgi:outer membrane protein